MRGADRFGPDPSAPRTVPIVVAADGSVRHAPHRAAPGALPGVGFVVAVDEVPASVSVGTVAMEYRAASPVWPSWTPPAMRRLRWTALIRHVPGAPVDPEPEV